MYMSFFLALAGFQSTPPAREATFGTTVTPETSKFQSTPPAREATPTPNLILYMAGVSIHASRTGGDPGAQRGEVGTAVSIHASRTGGDQG